ncbi:MAG: isochorismatase family protein [Planctomycetota bacterium]
MTFPRGTRLASTSSGCLVVIDMQERLLPVIEAAEQITRRCRFLLEAARLLSVPVVMTEQYPRGLGATIESLRSVAADAVFHEKLRFSAAEVLLAAGVLPSNVRQLVLTGIETHICVQQTALDLVAAGWDVILAADASSSRQAADKSTAVDRLRAAGVTISTVEAIAFEWCETAEHPAFRQLSALVRARESAGW